MYNYPELISGEMSYFLEKKMNKFGEQNCQYIVVMIS